jgi:hypothetical protein
MSQARAPAGAKQGVSVGAKRLHRRGQDAESGVEFVDSAQRRRAWGRLTGFGTGWREPASLGSERAQGAGDAHVGTDRKEPGARGR